MLIFRIAKSRRQLRKELKRVKSHRSSLEALGWVSTRDPVLVADIEADTARIREIEEELNISHPVQRRRAKNRVVNLDDHRRSKTG